MAATTSPTTEDTLLTGDDLSAYVDDQLARTRRQIANCRALLAKAAERIGTDPMKAA